MASEEAELAYAEAQSRARDVQMLVRRVPSQAGHTVRPTICATDADP
jgi:hypothetical protein